MPNGVFTIDDLHRAMALVREIAPPPLPDIYVTPHATEIVPGEYNFPPSKHRSRRIHKKLVKRFGSYEKRKPATLQVGDRIFMHPAHWHEMQRQLKHRIARAEERAFGMAVYGAPLIRS